MLLSLLWYAIDARKWFRGPKINVEHMIYRTDPEVVEGKEPEKQPPSDGSDQEIQPTEEAGSDARVVEDKELEAEAEDEPSNDFQQFQAAEKKRLSAKRGSSYDWTDFTHFAA